MRLPLPALLLGGLLAAPAGAQVALPEADGPFSVGWQDVNFSHPLAGNSVVDARLYYPSATSGQNALPDPSQGPFPQVGFLHGYFAFVDYYDDVCTHLASWGFFVASVATESGFFMSIPDEAADARAMLTWVEEQAAPGGPYAGMVPIGGDWSAVGHSNGGAACFHLASSEPRVERLVLFEPNWLNPPGVASFAGPVMIVGASQDIVAPAASNAEVYYDQLSGSDRRFYVVIEGSGHNGALDFPFELSSLPHDEAQALHRRLAAGFLRAEVAGVAGDEDLYLSCLGQTAEASPLSPRSRALDPALWAVPADGQAQLGIAGYQGDAAALIGVAATTTAIPTIYGELGIALLPGDYLGSAPMPADGSLELTLPYGPEFSGLSVAVQALRLAPSGEGALTRAALVVL